MVYKIGNIGPHWAEAPKGKWAIQEYDFRENGLQQLLLTLSLSKYNHKLIIEWNFVMVLYILQNRDQMFDLFANNRL